MARAFRVAAPRYARAPNEMLSGAGAKRFGGRWNTPGRAVVYASGSLALAILEIAVHLDNANVLPAFKALELDIPDGLIQRLDKRALPPGWNAPTVNPVQAQSIGDRWFDDGLSAVLEVPSAVIPLESNYLLNPSHPGFSRVGVGAVKDCPFDMRIKA